MERYEVEPYLLGLASWVAIAIVVARSSIEKHTGVPFWVFLLLLGGLCWCYVEARRRIKFFLDKCSHGQRRDSSGKRNCPSCEWEDNEGRKEHARRAAAEEQERKRLEAERQEQHLQWRREEAERIRHLEYLCSMAPAQFENVVLDVFRRFGWKADPTKGSGDHGVDGYLRRNGKLKILQCKRFTSGRVGEPDIRDLAGTVTHEKAAGGIIVTTATFSRAALAWAEEHPVLELINGSELIKMIRQAFPDGSTVRDDCQSAYPSGQAPVHCANRPGEAVSSPKQSPAITQGLLPTICHCPKCGKPTRIVKGRYGRFMGCTGYPECHWSHPLPNEQRPRPDRWLWKAYRQQLRPGLPPYPRS